jgi:hypothetical protein
MRPYTKAFYDDIALFSNPDSARLLSSLAKADVAMWRSYLVAANFDTLTFARPIESFRVRPPTVLFEYDASLSAFAVGVSVRDPASSPPVLLAYTAVKSPFTPTVEARKQNTYEYLAVLLGLLLARRLGLSHFSYDLIGDSVSSLTWIARDRAASALARRANVALSLVSVDVDATVATTTHLAGALNTVYDGLSRGLSGSAVGLDPARQITLPPHHPIVQYLQLCDPDLPLSSYQDHLDLSHRLLSLLRSAAYFQ